MSSELLELLNSRTPRSGALKIRIWSLIACLCGLGFRGGSGAAEGGYEVEALAGEGAGGSGTELDAFNVAGHLELFFALGSSLGVLDADGENGEVGQLDVLTLQKQLLDTAYHVGEHAVDGSFREGGVVTGHVGGELGKAYCFLDDGVGIPLAEHL